MANEMEPKSGNPIPGPNSAGPEPAAPHTDAQFLNLHPVIKSLAQCCSPVDSHFEGLSNSFCSFEASVLQLGVSMQRVFGMSFSSFPGLDSGKIPESAQCGVLATKLQMVAKANAELAAVKQRAAEERAVAMRAAAAVAAAAQSSRNHSNDSARSKSGDAFKSPEKTSRKPSKAVEVIVDIASDDEEHIDGVTDWIGALLQARHILPGGGHNLLSKPCPIKPSSAANQPSQEERAEAESQPAAAFCPVNDAVMLEELRLQVAALQKEVDRRGLEIASLKSVRSSLSDHRSAKAQALDAKLEAALTAHGSNVERLAEMESQLGSWHECVEQALAKVPLDTRAQFLIEVRRFNHLFFGIFRALTSRLGAQFVSERPSVLLAHYFCSSCVVYTASPIFPPFRR
jgi:hypothetical protein